MLKTTAPAYMPLNVFLTLPPYLRLISAIGISLSITLGGVGISLRSMVLSEYNLSGVFLLR